MSRAKPLPEWIYVLALGDDAARSGVECRACGARVEWTLPIDVGLFCKLSKAFVAGHRRCRPAPKGGAR